MSTTQIFPLFVYGTLMKGGRFHYYISDMSPVGQRTVNALLNEAADGTAFIVPHNSAETEGELYHVSFSCLQRIQHLETSSGSFPKSYDLATIRSTQGELVLYYKRRSTDQVVECGNWLRYKEQNLFGRLLKIFGDQRDIDKGKHLSYNFDDVIKLLKHEPINE